MRRWIVIFLSIFGLAASEHHGQVQFGGLPVPGATITAERDGKKLVAITDQQGAYSFKDLLDGAWTMRVEMLCFSPIQQEVTVAAGAPASEWDLKLLPLTEFNLDAKPPAPATPDLQTKIVDTPRPGAPSAAPPPAKKSGGFQRTDVNASAAQPSGGTPPPADAAPADASGDQSQRAADGFLINGSVNNGASSPFAINPAFGNFRKGARSLYNGSLGVIMDTSSLDARSFSLTGQDTPKPSYSHIQGVASFGGPIKIPHLIRNGPNVFLGYQWTRNRNASTSSSLMPDAAQRIGDFSHSLNALGQPLQIFDPITGAPFAGNVIPASRISAQAKALLGFYPLPNFAGGARYNYQIPIVGAMHQDALQTRVNKSLGRKNQLFGSFGLQSTRTDDPNIFAFLDTGNSIGINTNINWRHSFTQRLYATAGITFSRFSARTTPFFENRANVSGAAGIAGNNQEPVNWGPPGLSFSSGIAGLYDATPSSRHDQTSSFSYGILWNHNSHNISFGGDMRRQQSNLLSQQNPRGAFTFTGAATQATANGNAVQGTGSDFAGFLLGVPDTSSIAFGNADKYFRSSAYNLYFTDDWRINPGFTLNAGARWEYGSPITELYGRLVNLDISPGFTADAPVISRNPVGTLTGKKYPDSLVHPDKAGIEPRIGFSWRPSPASSMVVRGGYGVYYDTSVYTSIATRMAQQSPLSKSLSVQNTPASPLTLANGFNIAPGITPNTFAIDPNFRVGYSQNWQLSVQRDLPAALMMTATYLGIKGTRGAQQFLPNTFPAGAVNPCPACPTGFTYLTSNGNSTREVGQIQLRRRLHNGITASVQYAYSKSIDDAALGGRNQGGSLIAQDWLNLSGERARSNFDQRHLLTALLQYTSGMGSGGGTLLSGWRGGLFKEWTAATQITAGSGFPLTPIFVSAVRGTGVTGSIRPDYTGAPLYDAPPGLFLNPAAYAPPTPGHWGNAGRNSITGPSQFTMNASLGRTFRWGDRMNVDLRFDATNALNHVTFPSWITTYGLQFGLPAAANAMRDVQTTLRLRF